MRKLAIAVAAVVVLLIVILLAAPHFIDVNRYHDRIQAELTAQLGRPVSIGQLSLGLLPPQFTLRDAEVGEDASFKTGHPFAQARSLVVRVKLMPLIAGRVEVASLRLVSPQLELVKNANGVWNFASIGKGNQPVAGSGSSGKTAIGELLIDDGSVAITDMAKKRPRTIYDHIDLDLSDYAAGKPFSVDLAVHLPGPGRQVAKLSGKAGPINDANPVSTPFEGKFELDQVSLAGVQQFLNSPELANCDATVSGKAKFTGANGAIASSGSIKLESVSIHGNSIGYPIKLDYDVAHDLVQDVIHVNKATLGLGGTAISLSGSLNTKLDPSVADLKVEANGVSIVEVGQLAAAFGWAMTPCMEIAGKLSVDLHVQGALDSPSLNGTVKGRDLALGGKGAPAPVKVGAIDLTFTPQQVSSNEFTATAGRTSVAVRFLLLQYDSPAESVDASVHTSNANVGELIGIAQAAGVPMALGMSGKGTMSLDLHVTGPLKKLEAIQLNGSGNLQDASVKLPSLAQPVYVKSASLKFSGNSATLDGAQISVGSMNVSGSGSVRNFSAPQVQFTVAADKVNANELQNMVVGESSKSSAVGANTSLLDKMTGAGNVSAGQVQYDDLVVQNVKTNVAINRGVIMLNPVSAQSYGGTAAGSVTVETRGPKTQYNLTIKSQKVDVNQLMSALSSSKAVLYGQLTSNVQGNFSSAATGNDISKTLNGRASLGLADGKLTNVDVMNELAALAKFQSLGRQAQNFTKITQASGDFEIRNGVAQTSNLKAAIEGGSLAAAGTANLVDQSIDLHMTVVLNKDYSQTVGGTSVGGLMQTALANRNGELVLPVLVTGTLQKMKFAPDVEALARMRLQNLLPTGKGGLTGLLNSLGGKQQAPGQTKETPVDQLIDIFGKKKQKQKQ